MSAPSSPSLNQPRRRRVLLACSATVVCTQMYLAAMNVALPAIKRGLNATTADLQWSLNIYALVLASALLAVGALGDRFGRKRFMIIGMVVFILGTILGATAWFPPALIVARGLQGLGACMLPVISLAVINEVFTDPRERAGAIGVWNALMSIGIALGPVFAGALVTWFDWRAVFWAPTPLLILTLAAIIRDIPESRDDSKRRLDVPGQVLTAILLGALTFDIISFGEGVFGPLEWGLGAVFFLATLAFIWRETHTDSPMLDFRFFHSVPFVGGLAFMEFAFLTYGGFMFVFALYLQLDFGLDSLEAGLMMVPLAIANSIGAVGAGKLVGSDRYRAALLIAAGCTVLLGGVMLFVNSNGPLGLLIMAAALMGTVQAFTNLPVTNSILGAMPDSQAGVASATTSTARQIGMSLGIAIFGAFLNLGAQAGEPIHAAAHPVWWITIGLGVVAAVIAVVATTPWAKGTSEWVRQNLS